LSQSSLARTGELAKMEPPEVIMVKVLERFGKDMLLKMDVGGGVGVLKCVGVADVKSW
jgi:hypothetical protein